MLCCSIPSGSGAPVPAHRGAAMRGKEAHQPCNHASPASWGPRRTLAYLSVADASPSVVARSWLQSSRETPFGSSSERNDYIDVEARVHPSEEEEESLLLELAERLRRLKGRASGRQFSRVMRSGRVKLTAPRVCRLLRVLTDAGSWREALAVVQWIASRESTSVGLDRRILTTLVAGLGYKHPAAVLQVIQLMLSGRETWPDMPAYRAVAVALGRAGRLKELLQLVDRLRTGYQEPSQPNDLRGEDGATRSTEPTAAAPLVQSAAKERERDHPNSVGREGGGAGGDREGREGGEVGASSGAEGNRQERGEEGPPEGLKQDSPPLPPWMNAQQEASRSCGQPLAPDIVVYNAILTAVAWQKEWQGVAWVLQQMLQDGVPPNEVSYGLALKALCKGGRAKEVWEMMQKMESLGVQPNARTYKEIVELLGQQGRPAEAEALVARMEASGVPGSAAVLASLARVMCRCGRWQDAVSLLPRVCQAEGAEPPAVTATGLIRACEEAGRLEDACSLFRALVPQAPGPDPFPSLPKERGGAPLAPNEEAADSGEGRAATGALGRGPAPQEDARPPEVGPSPNSSPETSTSTSPSPSISPSTSPNASLRSGQGQGEVSGGLPADELGGRRGRAKRARGRKGRREGQGGTASESPPSVVVVPNIIMCNVMLKMYGKTGRFKDACWMMDQIRRGRVGGGRHAVGEERLSADAHTWDAFLGCCIQSHEWAAAEAAVGDRTRQGFPLRMERHSWALDAALNARQESLAAALTRHMQEAVTSISGGRAFPSSAAGGEGPNSTEDSGATSSAESTTEAGGSEARRQETKSTGASRQEGGTSIGGGRGPATSGGRPWRPPAGNPVLWHLDQVVAAGGGLDEFSWRYAIHSVGPALTAGAVREVLARVKAQEALPRSRSADSRTGSSLDRDNPGRDTGRGGSSGQVGSLSRGAMAGILVDLCRAVAHGGGRAEAVAAVQLVEEMLRRGLSPPHGLLSSVLQRCLRFGLSREAALLKTWAAELQTPSLAARKGRGDLLTPWRPQQRDQGPLRPKTSSAPSQSSPFFTSGAGGAGKRAAASASPQDGPKAGAWDSEDSVSPRQDFAFMSSPLMRSEWAQGRAGLQGPRERGEEREGDEEGLLGWGSEQEEVGEGEGMDWGWGAEGAGGEEGKTGGAESTSDASAAKSKGSAVAWLSDDAPDASAPVPGAQEILTLWEEQARGGKGKKWAG